MSGSRTLVFLVALLLHFSWSASAQTGALRFGAQADVGGVTAAPVVADGPLLRAVRHEALRATLATPATHLQEREVEHRSWASRHPVLLGALVGGTVGSLVLGLTESASDHPEAGEGFIFGFALGAGAGALVGAIVK